MPMPSGDNNDDFLALVTSEFFEDPGVRRRSLISLKVAHLSNGGRPGCLLWQECTSMKLAMDITNMRMMRDDRPSFISAIRVFSGKNRAQKKDVLQFH